ncbi:hypothetical protein BWI17_01940 [Betaproteobacteria bacterium GR16-43]|nr:hypothetical protein BWI17_01940 [Betaproteobacteria bacterium GR16-43]
MNTIASRIAIVAAVALAAGFSPDGHAQAGQNWTPEVSQGFWFTSQGSRILPAKWFAVLEQSGNTTLFRDDANITRLGYIPAKASTKNPDGFPIGFAVDRDAPDQPWLGLTCAACHTTQLVYKDKLTNAEKKILIEGGPGMADFNNFYRDLIASLAATMSDDAKFARFAANVLGAAATPAARTDLRAALTKVHAANAARYARNLPTLEAGYGRLDAFGNIFNEVLVPALSGANKAEPPDAPVSYPFLWDTPQHDRVQWNGIAPNNLLGLGALSRNTSEVIGVFGDLHLEDCKVLGCSYSNHIAVRNLGRLEFWLKQLWSPQWNDNGLPSIDSDAAKRGKDRYDEKCLGCHERIVRTDPDRTVTAKMVDVMSDDAMARLAATRSGSTGPLNGTFRRGTFKKFGPTEPADGLLTNGLVGVLLGDIAATLAALDEQRRGPSPLNALTVEAVPTATSAAAVLNDLRSYANDRKELLDAPAASNAFTVAARYGTYKARPLNGIWATAPYLHNGSVPNLTELLKAPAERVKKFFVGNREIDTVNVGLVSTSGPFEFDTSKPGNLNAGHEYGTTTLTPDQKKDLIEYLKTL